MRHLIKNIKRIKLIKCILLVLFIVDSLDGIAQTYNVEYAFTIVDYYSQYGNPSDYYLCSVYFETMNGGKLHSILSEASRLTHSKGGTLNIPDVDGAPTDFIISYSNGGEFSAFNALGVIFTKKSFFSNNNCGEIYFNYNYSAEPYYCSTSYTFYPDLSDILTSPVDPALPLDNPIQIAMQTNSFPIDVFHWEFSVDGGTTWISSSAVGSSLSAKTLFGTKLNANDYINQNVLLKLNPWGDPTKTKGCSKTVYTYEIKASPPNITKIDTTAPKCSTSEDGKVSITIDRELDTDEILILNLYESDYPDGNPKTEMLNNSQIHANIPYVLGYRLTPKSYYLKYYTKFKKSDGTYSDPSNNATSSPFNIGSTDAVTFTAKHTDISCYGSKNGTITLSATGGAKSYSYTLTADGYSKTDSFKLGNIVVIPISSPKTYALVVTDKNGCSAVKDVNSKDDPTAIVVTQPTEIKAAVSKVDNTCYAANGGSITLSASGGSGNYNYAVTTADGYSKTGSCIENEQVRIPDLYSKTYQVTLTDKQTGCPANSWSGSSTNGVIPISDLNSAINVVVSKVENTCYGGNGGSITLSASGGSGNYNYTVTAYGYSKSGSFTKDNPVIVPDLYSKTYQVSITDKQTGCSVNSWSGSSTNGLIPISDQHSAITATVLKQDIPCGKTVGSSITLQATGGSGGYNYSVLKNGILYQSGTFSDPLEVSNPPEGTYSVAVTDEIGGCPVTTWNGVADHSSFQIIKPEPITLESTDISEIKCYGDVNGAITVHAKGGVGTLSYSWSGDRVATNTNTITGLGAGTYTVTISDATTCPIYQTYILKSKYSQIIPTLKATDVSCYGRGDGKAEVTSITGGTGPYTCKWSNNADGLVATNLSPGFYYVTITDAANGCTAISSPVKVTQYDPLTVTLTRQDPTGFGKGDGSITAEVKDGNGGNEYVWTGTDFEGTKFTSTATSVSGLKAGDYSLTVTDKNGCRAGASVSLTQPAKLVVDLHMSKPVSCTSDMDGTLSAKASGGVPDILTGNYKYSWLRMKSDGNYEDILDQKEVDSTYPGLGAGTYKVKVEDSNGNISESVNTITLINPEPLAISSQSITDVKCHDDYTGEIHFTVTGGTGSYTYLNGKGETISNNLTKLHAGKYVVTIKDTNGCWLDHEFIVSEPSAPLSVTLAKKELSAYHASDAELVGTITGGTPPYFKIWEGNNSTTETASGLTSGTYKLKVTDNNGCTAEASASFIDPLKVDIVVKHSIDCCGEKGELAARTVGGEPNPTVLPYKYTWYKHDINTGTSTLLFPPVREDESNDSVATDLPEGYYSVKIDDRHNRTLRTDSFHLMQPDTIKFRVDSMNVSCKGENNGFIRATTTGGSGLYKYLWNNGSRSSERTNLPPGNYTVWVSDSLFNCAAVPASRTITITEPDKLTLSLQKRDVLLACDGKIEAIASGGTRPYHFRWNDADETTDSIRTLLCDGNYKLEVIDKNGCTATASILLPPPLVVKISVQDSINCFGDNNGSLVVHAQGGVPYKIGKPYRYSWKKQNASGIYEELTVGKDSISGLITGWYALNITDSIGVTLKADSVFYLSEPEPLAIRIQKTNVLCHGASTGAISAVVTGGLKPYALLWNTGSTDAELQNIKAGTYTITATDRHGCTKQYPVTIEQPDSLMIGFTNIIAPTTSTACNGSLTASVSGGVRPYTYQWSDTNANTATADHLCYGTFYTVTVTDSVGCSAQVTKTSKFAPPPFVVSLSVRDSVQCHGAATGAIAARVSGGIPFTVGKPYTYIWKKKNNTGEYRSIVNSNDSIIKNLTSGWYAFDVQDAEFNTTAESVYFYLPEPDTLALTVSQTNITCKDLHNGNASVRVSGGVLPYAYKWSNGETSPSIDNLAPGEYSIEVTDKHGCMSRQSITVTEPELLSVSFQPKLISEHNVCDGSLRAVVKGGTAPFSYAWNGVNSTASIVSSLCAADYSVTVTDAHGCSANQKITLSNPPTLRLSLAVQDSIKCNGNVQGVLVTTAQGGIPFASGKKYRYTWKKKNSRGVFETMPAYADSIATDLTAGTYACNITDANGISLHQDSVILLPEPTELWLAIQQKNIGCSGAAEGSATVIPSGGSLPYSYAWSTGDKTATVRNLSSGSYIVRVTDRNGCVAARQVYISKAAPLYLFLYKKQPVCYQSCDGAIGTSVSGGIPPYTYQWTGSTSTGSEARSLCAGRYSLLVTDAAGCSIQKNDSLQNPLQLPLNLGANRYICSGQTIRYNITIPSKTGITYNWSGPNGFTSSAAIVDLTEAGTYTASVTDVLGCNNTGTVTLTPSGTTVENEFALPTQAFINEQIVVVNTTYPAPDSIRWILPEKALIKSIGQSYAEFVLPETGSYVIKMVSYKGVCSSIQEKVLIVSERSKLNDVESAKTPFIQSFSATPNPSHGNFTTKIVLQNKADVQLKLINILSNATVFQSRQSGDSTYEIPINVSTLSGTYLLLLETPKGTATLKVIIFKP